MTQQLKTTSFSIHAWALAAAVGLGLAQLASIDAIAQARSVSPHAQIVELERVVVVGQRMASPPPATSIRLAMACPVATSTVC